MATVVVLGAGVLGAPVLKGLATYPEVTRLHVFDINPDLARVEALDAAVIADRSRQESVDVRFRAVDMKNEDQLAEALRAAAPDVIVQAATLYSWYGIVHMLPPEQWKEIAVSGRFGPWLPLNLPLPMRLMRARAAAGLSSPVVNVSYPDAVNAVLGKLGSPPACGAGNTEHISSILRIVSARKLGVPTKEIAVNLIAHHFHGWALREAGLQGELKQRPFWYRVVHNGDDVTARLNGDGLIDELKAVWPRQRAMMAASSVIKNVVRLLRDDPTVTHAAGPAGLGGGFDVRLGRAGVEVVLPAGLTMADALAIAANGQAGDGIAEIRDDGSVRFVPGSVDAMKRHLGYDCAILRLDEVEERAEELIARMRALVKGGAPAH